MAPGLPGIGTVRRIRNGIVTRWLDRRIPLEPPRITLHRRRLFILPTQLGYTYGLTLVLLLLGSLNYGTSLGFAITFLLAGAGALGMLHTYRNLEGVTVHFAPPAPVFAGQAAEFPVRIESARGTRWALEISGGAGEPLAAAPSPAAPADCLVAIRAGCRGRVRPPRLRLVTRWPLALFRVWSWVWPRVSGVVYPAAVDHGLPFPEVRTESVGDRPRPGGDEDFAGLREYRRGDPPRRIAWKALARTDELRVKAFESAPAGDVWLDWAVAHLPDPEARLEQLCHWVLTAETAGRRYGLLLPGMRIPPNGGAAHRARCLETLALFRQPDADDAP